jgi:hypothetical protein
MREESSSGPSSMPPVEAGEPSSGPLYSEVEEAKPSNSIKPTPGAASTMAERAHNNQEDQDQEQEQNRPTKMSHRRERRREQVYRDKMTATASAAGTSTTVTDPADACKYPGVTLVSPKGDAADQYPSATPMAQPSSSSSPPRTPLRREQRREAAYREKTSPKRDEADQYPGAAPMAQPSSPSSPPRTPLRREQRREAAYQEKTSPKRDAADQHPGAAPMAQPSSSSSPPRTPLRREQRREAAYREKTSPKRDEADQYPGATPMAQPSGATNFQPRQRHILAPELDLESLEEDDADDDSEEFRPGAFAVSQGHVTHQDKGILTRATLTPHASSGKSSQTVDSYCANDVAQKAEVVQKTEEKEPFFKSRLCRWMAVIW